MSLAHNESHPEYNQTTINNTELNFVERTEDNIVELFKKNQQPEAPAESEYVPQILRENPGLQSEKCLRMLSGFSIQNAKIPFEKLQYK